MLDLLARHIRQGLAPAEIAIALYQRDSAGIAAAHIWPAGAPVPLPLFELATRRGALLVAGSDLENLLAAEGLGVPDGLDGSWCLVPLLARGRITGVVAVRSLTRRFAAEDLELLEALATQASVALESAHLVDLHDDGRRSWQEVVDALALALCIVDRSGRIRRANRAFAGLVDAPLATLVGRPWTTFAPPEWRAEIRRVLDEPGSGTEVPLRLGDRTFTVSAVPTNESDRSVAVLLFDDQTERRRLYDQLLQSEKMSAIGQLIAGVAHDLNNPLASVVGFADFLGEVRDVPPQLREPLAVIREEAERASGIVKSLLTFARKQERQRRSTQLGTLLDSTQVLLRNELLAQHVEMRIEVEPDLPAVDIDPNQIQQVFVNLIHNAAHAIASTGRPGEIVVRARRWLDGVDVEIADNGPGMTPELASQVFDPFFTTKPEGQGTGLGLSISQGIVREHGGRITLATESGAGSTFTVHLPAGTPVPVVAEAPPPARSASRLSVLVVDDEPHILHYMRATLETWGHAVAVAADGSEALELANAQHFDLIISDLRMPRLGGREFYHELEASHPHVARRLVFSTGDTVRGDTLEFLEELGRPFLHKPFSLAELRSLLATVAPEPADPTRGEPD